MNAIYRRRLLSAIASGVVCLLAMPLASAMPIAQFDKIDRNDKSDYVTLLVQGAAKGLADHGQTDQAKKVMDLFRDPSVRGGAHQFAQNLQAARELNAQNATDPNNKQPPYEVENALAVTLKQNGIVVPVSFLLSFNKDFKPSSHAK